MCPSSGECIKEKDVCDGDIDCPLNWPGGDADDESYAEDGPCHIKATNCTFNGKRPNEFFS